MEIAEMRQGPSWDDDWYAVDSATERKWAEDELRGELCQGHILVGLEATAVGRRRRRDDVLFRLCDGRLAQVHLTRRPEADLRYPDTQIYATFEDWRAVPVEDR
jgi:hypothetical protein